MKRIEANSHEPQPMKSGCFCHPLSPRGIKRTTRSWRYSFYKDNNVVRRSPLPIIRIELSLNRSARFNLSQIRLGYSKFLRISLPRVNDEGLIKEISFRLYGQTNEASLPASRPARDILGGNNTISFNYSHHFHIDPVILSEHSKSLIIEPNN